MKNKVQRHILPNFKTYFKAIVIKTVCYCHKDEHRDDWKRIENPEINPYIYGQLIFNKGVKTIQRETIVFSINSVRVNRYSHAKE